MRAPPPEPSRPTRSRPRPLAADRDARRPVREHGSIPTTRTRSRATGRSRARSDWFFTLTGVSDTRGRAAHLPDPGRRPDHRAARQPRHLRPRPTASCCRRPSSPALSLIKGSTAFKPPEIEYRLTLAFNVNYAQVPERRSCRSSPAKPPHRIDAFVGVQEAFVDYHLRNVSDRYDFDSIRVGIQPFPARFPRLPVPGQPAGRAPVRRPRQQPLPVQSGRLPAAREGHQLAASTTSARRCATTMIVRGQPLPPGPAGPRPHLAGRALIYNAQPRGAARSTSTTTASRSRPALIGDLRARDYDVVYLGYNADGHIGRLNLTASAYGAFGQDRNSIFTNQPGDHRQLVLRRRAVATTSTGSGCAARPSMRRGDKQSVRQSRRPASTRSSRTRISPAPTPATGSASRSPSPAAAARSAINGRNGVLNDLRSSKERGPVQLQQSGHDPAGRRRRLRPAAASCGCSANVNHLWFADTAVLQALRNEGSDPAATSAGTIRLAADLAAEDDPEHRLPRLGGGASTRQRASAICSPTAAATAGTIRSCSTRFSPSRGGMAAERAQNRLDAGGAGGAAARRAVAPARRRRRGEAGRAQLSHRAAPRRRGETEAEAARQERRLRHLPHRLRRADDAQVARRWCWAAPTATAATPTVDGAGGPGQDRPALRRAARPGPCPAALSAEPGTIPVSANPKQSYTLLNREAPEFVRFVNPSDYRVARESCGACHLEVDPGGRALADGDRRDVLGRRGLQ